MPAGFSTIELLIALALMLTCIVAALDANVSAQYWRLSAVTAHEALGKATEAIGELRIKAVREFDMVSSTSWVASNVSEDPSDEWCAAGSWCYLMQTQVTEVSPCVKTAAVSTSWKIAARYPTSTVTEVVLLTKLSELIARGSDCLLAVPNGAWLSNPPSLVTQATHTAQFTTSMDVLGNHVYVVASSAPQLRIYRSPSDNFGTLVQVGTSSSVGNRLNAVDVVRDMATGRQYAFVVQHTATEQLVVIDVTDEQNPLVVTTRTLSGVSAGSFPQGWRLVMYGDRLYVLTRETAGPELHIFSLADPRNPIELVSGLYNLGRTVNDVAVREQMIDGVVHRLLFLAASAALKEFAIFDVTHDVPVEVSVLNLPGSEDLMSMSLVGNLVYLGRKNSAAGPELMVFDMTQLRAGVTTPLAAGEVGADVISLRATGPLLFIGTNKSGAEFQVWQSNSQTWNPLVQNAGRVSARSNPRQTPLGLEIADDFIYLLNQSGTQPETLTVVYTP